MGSSMKSWNAMLGTQKTKAIPVGWTYSWRHRVLDVSGPSRDAFVRAPTPVANVRATVMVPVVCPSVKLIIASHLSEVHSPLACKRLPRYMLVHGVALTGGARLLVKVHDVWGRATPGGRETFQKTRGAKPPMLFEKSPGRLGPTRSPKYRTLRLNMALLVSATPISRHVTSGRLFVEHSPEMVSVRKHTFASPLQRPLQHLEQFPEGRPALHQTVRDNCKNKPAIPSRGISWDRAPCQHQDLVVLHICHFITVYTNLGVTRGAFLLAVAIQLRDGVLILGIEFVPH
jgi:hypothetical protein